MKRKITLSTLEELSGAISHNDLANYLGGGSGTQNDPFTFSEYMTLGWAFTHGWVKMSDGNISYLTENYFSYSGCTDNCYNGTSNYWGSSWMFNNSDYYGSSASSSSTLEKALTGAGISVGVEAFLEDIVEQICRSDAARQQLYSAAKASVKAGKIAGNISKGCGVVGLVLSIGGSFHSLVAVVDGTAEAADYLNGISILSAATGVVCAFTGVGLPVTLVCDGVSIGCSIAAEIVEQ